MKKTLFFIFSVLALNQGFSQNLITNGDFELGTKPTGGGQITKATGWTTGCRLHDGVSGTPDLYDASSILPTLDGISPRNVPNNKRFGAIYQDQNHGESLLASLTTPFAINYDYTIGFYVAGHGWGPAYQLPPVNYKIEVVLRKAGNCTLEKIVYTSPTVIIDNIGGTAQPSANWHAYGGSFAMSQADINVGYDKVEIRINGLTQHLTQGIDDVTLTRTPATVASFVFANPGQTEVTMNTLYGPGPVTETCLPTILINGGASANEDRYHIEIAEFNPATYTNVGPALYSAWQCTGCTVPTTNINLTALLASVGKSFSADKVYRVSLSVGPTWNSVTKFVRPKSCTSTASYVFINSDQTNVNLPSKYGTQQVVEMCNNWININGAASAYETSYYIELAEFNLVTWTNVTVFYSQWVCTGCQVPSSININLLPGANIQVGKVYKLSLSVGPDWNTMTKFFRVKNCSKSGEVLLTEVGEGEADAQISMFPNPVTDVLNLTANEGQSFKSVSIYDMGGSLVRTETLSAVGNEERIDLSTLIKGMYLVEVTTDKGTIQRSKIIKE